MKSLRSPVRLKKRIWCGCIHLFVSMLFISDAEVLPQVEPGMKKTEKFRGAVFTQQRARAPCDHQTKQLAAHVISNLFSEQPAAAHNPSGHFFNEVARRMNTVYTNEVASGGKLNVCIYRYTKSCESMCTCRFHFTCWKHSLPHGWCNNAGNTYA